MGDAGEVRVRTGGEVARAALAQNKRAKSLAERDPANSETIVVVGGGAAGQVRDMNEFLYISHLEPNPESMAF